MSSSDSKSAQQTPSTQGSKDFDRVESSSEIIRYLSECSTHRNETLLWTANQDYVVNTHMVHLNRSNHKMTFWCPSECPLEAMKAHLVHKRETDCLFKIAHPNGTLFFKARHLKLAQTGFEFDIPDELFRVQRRQSARYRISTTQTLKVEFKNPLFPDERMTKKVYDLSAVGISFLVEDQDAALFPDGMMLDEMRFKLNSKEVRTQGEVKHSQKIVDTLKRPMIRVGAKLTLLSQDDDRTISLYVLEEMRKFMGRSG